MLNSIRTYSNNLIPVLQEKIPYSLSDLQKRILTIVSIAFGCLAACYLAKYCYQRSCIKPIDDNDEDNSVPLLFQQAIELMFEDRKLGWPSWFKVPLTDQQKADRHEELKKVIAKLDKQELDLLISYRDGMATRQNTLLLQAIQEISDPDRRFEIVDILLKKGANPSQTGFYYAEVLPIEAAKETKDAKLIQRIQDALFG